MPLHNPSNMNLPPLMINKSESRLTMEKTPTITNFIASKLLLEKKFYLLFVKLNKISQQIAKNIESGSLASLRQREMSLRNLPWHISAPSRKDYLLMRRYSLQLRHPRIRMTEKEKEEAEKVILQLRSKESKRLISLAKRHSSQVQNQLSRFEQEHKTSLNILTPVTLFICRNCNTILFRNRFQQKDCLCGQKVKTISNTRKEPLAYFDSKLSDFILQNYWFEYGIDHLLRKKNLQTLCEIHVLGHSGNWHEIDNMAESKSANFRFFCECKTANVTVGDVFVLAGKMADIGCSRGYIFTMTKDIPKETQHLARSRNISIISNVLNKSSSSLLSEIRED